MTKDEIIALAKEAGAGLSCIAEPLEHPWKFSQAELERFAALVADKAAAKERDACAKLCDEMQEHWSAIKDTALLNGDVALSNASSGEPRAAEALAAFFRAMGKP